MNFELAEIVPVNDAEKVLQVLELHLRGVAAEVVRTDGRITAYGIGPSPRIVNRRDTTVVAAAAVDGVTRLTAHVNYQASALLGNSPQNEIVKAKIERALDEMRAELRAAKPWVPRMDSAPGRGASEFAAEKKLPVTPRSVFAPQKELFEKPGLDGTPAFAGPTFAGPAQSRNGSHPRTIEASSVGAAVPAVEAPGPRPADKNANKRSANHSGSRQAFSSGSRQAFSSGSRPAVSSGSRKAVAAGSTSSAGRTNFASSASRAAATNTASDIAARKSIEVAAPPVVAEIIPAKGGVFKKLTFQGTDRRTGPQAPVKQDGLVNEAGRKERRRIAPMVEVPLRGLMRAQGGEIEDAVPAHRWWKIALVAGALILPMTAVAGYEFRDRLPAREFWKTNLPVWSHEVMEITPLLRGTYRVAEAAASAPASVEAKAAPAADLPAATPVASQPADEPAAREPVHAPTQIVAAPKRMVKPEKTLYLWLRDWAGALTSRDPAAQASYYADTVHQYFDRTGVSRHAVIEDKTASIQTRGPEWNVTIDRVYIVSQSATGAKLRAVKHMRSLDAAGHSSETAVKVRLTVVRVRDLWKIVEEQEADLNGGEVSPAAKRTSETKIRRGVRHFRHG